MPEIRVALFGANPNRKFLDWESAVLEEEKTLKNTKKLLLFLCCDRNDIIPFVCEEKKKFRCKQRRIVVVWWCIVVFYLCIKGHDRRCSSTLEKCIMGTAQAVTTGLLSCSPPPHLFFFFFFPVSWFTLISVGGGRGRLIGWMFNRSFSNWISLHDKHTASVS